MDIPQNYIQRLVDMGGRLPDGTPKMRLVFGPDARKPHGKLQGHYKYVNPDTGRPMPFWIVEQWYPPEMCGSREAWPTELMGPFPADCDKECCNRGFWGIRFPITTDGSYVELNDAVMDYITERQYADLKFSMLDEISRQEHLDKLLAEREKNTAEVINATATEIGDDYFSHKEKEDNADNRVYSISGLNGKGIKEPVGRPKI